MSSDPTAFLRKENTRLKDENEALRKEVSALREFVQLLDKLGVVAKTFQNNDELLPLLREILEKSLRLLNAPDGSLALLDDASDELVFVLVHGTLGADLQGFRLPADEGIAGWVIKNREPVLVRDVRHDSRFSQSIDDQFKFKTLSIAAAPLISGEKVLGVIEVLNQPGDNPFSEFDLALLDLVCRAAGNALAHIEETHPGTD